MDTPYKKKLIEVALPLEAINVASAKEKSIRHGHPSTLHLWWARRPLAACRAVLFAQLVDDPSEHIDELLAQPDSRRLAEARFEKERSVWERRNEEAKAAGLDPGPAPTLGECAAAVERDRLFAIIEDLVKWENTTNETVLERARAEIRKSCGDDPPPVYDPFCGGGSIPLEAQRLGLKAYGSDLNPVAVLITKALVEIPPKFAGHPPVNPESQEKLKRGAWNGKGAQGLAEDVRFYGQWMRDEAYQRIGHLYPPATLPDGGSATVIAWLWARTVVCPNPACRAEMPLVGSFFLSTKDKNSAWLDPVIERNTTPPAISFDIKTGSPPDSLAAELRLGTGYLGKKGKKAKAVFRCVACGQGPVKGEYIDDEANKGRMGVMPLAVVAEATRGRVYLTASPDQSAAALSDSRKYLASFVDPSKIPSEPCRGTFASNAQGRIYGFKTFGQYFTPRQLVALTTFSDLVLKAREKVLADANAAGLPSGQPRIADGGTGADAYADAVAIGLAFAVDKVANLGSTLCSWMSDRGAFRETFARQGVPMVWDFAEANLFSGTGGNFLTPLDKISQSISATPALSYANISQKDAANNGFTTSVLFNTDPPYYNNIDYADLSDFFYVWLRRSLKGIYPDLFGTLLVPKAQELVATPYRHGSKEKAEAFFMAGMSKALTKMAGAAHPDYPMTIYYAFKQSEVEREGVASTGWATFLDALIRAGLAIDGTWPVRTEGSGRIVAKGTNALASSIVLVCRKRPASAPVTTRADFIKALRSELPAKLKLLQHGNIAPVDLAQASIGPGMAIFSRYAKVLEADDSPMTVKTALQLINQALDRFLSEQEGEYDADTRFAITWFETHGMDAGSAGQANVLANARNISVVGVASSGILQIKGDKVRLLNRDEMPADWDPVTDMRVTVWEGTQHLIRRLNTEGERAAADLLARLGSRGEVARDLAYRLYGICERKKWADEALAYNGLVVAWPELTRLAAQVPTGPAQAELAI